MVIKTIIFMFATLVNQTFTCQPVRSVPNARRVGYLVDAKFDGYKRGQSISVKTVDLDALEALGVSYSKRVNQTNEPLYEYTFDPKIGKIQAVIEIRNDIDSLSTIFRRMERCISDNSLNVSDVARFEANYVRTIKTSYSDSKWIAFCGDASVEKEKYATIEQYFKSWKSLKIDDYFYAFSGGIDSINNNLHTHETDEPIASGNIKLIDPYDVDKSIDLLHMFAVNSSFISDQMIPNVISFGKTLSSWGGDLQQEANLLGTIKVTDFEKVLNEEITYTISNGSTSTDSLFPYSDLSADMDGQGLAYMFETLDKETSSKLTTMSSRVDKYYSMINNEQDRYNYFLNSSVHYGGLFSTKEASVNFQGLAFDILDMTLWADGSITDGSSVTQEDEIRAIKYKILNNGEEYGGKGSKPSFDCRKALAKSFCTYILTKCGRENEIAFK